jgi:phage shock protein C
MYCTQCGVQLGEDACYCSQCGKRTALAPVTAPRTLMLDKSNKKIGGVCAGFARHLDLDVTLVRVLWLVIAFSTGIGFLAYLVAWIVMPSDHGLEPRPVFVQQPQRG